MHCIRSCNALKAPALFHLQVAWFFTFTSDEAIVACIVSVRATHLRCLHYSICRSPGIVTLHFVDFALCCGLCTLLRTLWTLHFVVDSLWMNRSHLDPWNLLLLPARLPQVFVAGRPTGPASLTPSCQSSKILSLLFSRLSKKFTRTPLLGPSPLFFACRYRRARQKVPTTFCRPRLTPPARGFPCPARCARHPPRPLAHNPLMHPHVRTERCCLVLHCTS